MKYILRICFLGMVLCTIAGAQGDPPQGLTADSAAVAAVTATITPPPAPPTDVKARDTKNDHGHSITLSWQKSPDDGDGTNAVIGYQVFRWVPDFSRKIDSLRQVIDTVLTLHAKYESYVERSDARMDNTDRIIDDSVAFMTRRLPGLDSSIAALNLRKDSLAGTPDSLLDQQLSSAQALKQRYETYIQTAKSNRASLAEAIRTTIRDSVAMMEPKLPEFGPMLRQLRNEYDAAIDLLPDKYKLYPDSGSFVNVGTAPAGATTFVNSGAKEPEDGSFIPDFADFYFRVDAVTIDPAVRVSSAIVGPVQSKGQFFNTGRIPVLAAVLLFAFLTIWFVYHAKRGANLYVRPLGGIEAVDDAIGRATEMGKPILYVLGLGTAADIATIASFTILGRVAKRVAEYQTNLIVPCYDPIVMSVAQEVVKSSYLDAGRPDFYREESVYFVTQSQFAYVAAVNGTMLRELPATNVYMGKFYAESLLLAETGALAGSIQISGTDEVSQIPFFVVACDYTLIGEELYAASAYLAREPLLLGSLKAQDYAKAAIIILAIIGMLAVNIGTAADADWLLSFKSFFQVVD